MVNSNASLREENAKLNAEVSVLESNLSNLQTDVAASDDIINNLNLIIEDLRAQVTSLMNENNKLQNDLNAEKAKVTTLTNDKNRLQNDLNAANSTISSLNERLSKIFFDIVEYDKNTRIFKIRLGSKIDKLGYMIFPSNIPTDVFFKTSSGSIYNMADHGSTELKIYRYFNSSAISTALSVEYATTIYGTNYYSYKVITENNIVYLEMNIPNIEAFYNHQLYKIRFLNDSVNVGNRTTDELAKLAHFLPLGGQVVFN